MNQKPGERIEDQPISAEEIIPKRASGGGNVSEDLEPGLWGNRTRLLPIEEALLEKYVVGLSSDAAILDVGTGAGIFLLAYTSGGSAG